MKIRLLLLLCAVSLMTMAQVTTTPDTLHKEDLSGKIVITFDPAGGNGGMKSATKCYCHTGLITSESTDDTDWKSVIGSWRGSTQPQLTATADGKWQLEIDNVYTFYNVPATTEIIKLAFVFHDGPSGSKEGKTSTGGDIYVSIAGVDEEVGIWRGFKPDSVTEQARPAGIVNGIYYDESDPTKVTLCTYAASKTAPAQHVYVLGDMTSWKLNNAYQMKRDGNYFWITLTGLTPGKEYRFQYAVMRDDGVKKQICDLFSEKVVHPDDKYEPKQQDPTLISYPTTGADGGYVTVIQTNKTKYNWSSETLNFKRPDKNNLIIYELWVYDFTPTRNYKGLTNRLDYIKNLGANAIELMPICEFEGQINWGYSPCLYFAPDKAYGSSDDLKQLIDECHKRGIAVILDMVFNHGSGLNPMNKLYPYGDDLKNNPWFNVTAPHKDGDQYGQDWNHTFAPSHDMFTRSLKYWLEEYKVDGYRLDLSHGLCGTTVDCVTNLIDYYNNGVQAASPGAYLILEHWPNDNSDYAKLISAGMLCWANTNNAYCQAAMGWLKDGDEMTGANQDGYVSYAESHDEERMQYKAKMYGNGTLMTDTAARLDRVPAMVAMNVLLNGSHMLWQFEEVGYDYSINSNIADPDAKSGTHRTDPKPSAEPYLKDTKRLEEYERCAQAIQLRTSILPSVFEGNPTASNLASGVAVRTVQWGSDVFVAANVSVASNIVSMPSGTWYDYLAGGTKVTASTVAMPAGALKIYTGTSIAAPSVPDPFAPTAVESTYNDQSTYTSPYKFLHNGVICIERGNEVYDVMGRKISDFSPRK